MAIEAGEGITSVNNGGRKDGGGRARNAKRVRGSTIGSTIEINGEGVSDSYGKSYDRG